MRILVAGATGVIGRRLVPRLVQAGHDVLGTTRRPERAAVLTAIGAQPIVADAYDAARLADALAAIEPDVVMHQLTDLAGEDREANARLRIEGTANLVGAAKAAGVETMIAQSIAWIYAPGASPAAEDDPLDEDAPAFPGVSALEAAVATVPRGVILRYGTLYGPGTWYARDGAMADRARKGELRATPAVMPFLHADDAVAAAVDALDWPAGPVNVVDDDSAGGEDWLPAFCESVGAPAPRPAAGPAGRPVSNSKAKALGWLPAYPSWREGFRDT